jgi:hypothetical protein
VGFEYPSAARNSAGQDPDPITDERERRANRILEAGGDLIRLFTTTEFFEDFLHYRPHSSLPQAQRDAIRLRRRRAFRNSGIPWIVTDAAGLLEAVDDVDDILKSKRFLGDYIVDPITKTAKSLAQIKAGNWRHTKAQWERFCNPQDPPRTRKRGFYNAVGLNGLALVLARALPAIFPSWRFISLFLQFAQTTDMLFGVGIQLGPALGRVMEIIARGLEGTGLPFGPDHNKYNQLKAARIAKNTPKLTAAAKHMDPDDALSVLFGMLLASDTDVLPHVVISPNDYPDIGEIFGACFPPNWDVCGPAIVDQVGNFAALAASLPYNAGAGLVNYIYSNLLANWSDATENVTPIGAPTYTSGQRAIGALIELGVCTPAFCAAEADQILPFLIGVTPRVDIESGVITDPRDVAERFGFPVTRETLPSSGIVQTPVVVTVG